MESQSALDLLYDRLFRKPLDFSLDLADYASPSTLALAPATALIALCPIFYYQYQTEREIISPGKLLWAKLVSLVHRRLPSSLLNSFPGQVSASALLAIGLVNVAAPAALSLQIPGVPFQTKYTDFFAAVCLLPIIYSKHKRTFRSSSTLSAWFVVAILCDLTRTRLYSPSTIDRKALAFAFISTALKAVLLILEELPKKGDITNIHLRESVRWQSTCGFLTRNLLVWPYEEVLFGFRHVEQIEQLSQLDPEHSAERLANRFSNYWVPSKCFVFTISFAPKFSSTLTPS